MELRACVALLRDVTRAIQHAHENGIIHRDVKPQNVMIDATGRAVVMDFGLARHVKESRRLTLSGIAIGTPSYMSPEHAQGSKGELDPRSDVYSLGAILFEILTGRPPFIGESPMQIMLATVQDDAPAPRSLNPDAPADLEAICLKAIEKEKERRYATAGEFADELERWLGGERVRARPPSPTARWVRKVGPGRGTALLAGAIVLVVAAAVVFSWERRVERRLEVSARLRVAAVLEEAERFEHARSEYSAALALDPANASARDGIDRCGRESERRSRARRHFDAAMLRFSAGEDAPAIEEFDAALRAFDRFGVAYHYRALAHERAGRTEEAAKDMERAAKAEPGNPVYRFELERLRKKAGR
ncbi:MAG: protein kinase [Planctomycetes bacterium]|nr:protein kinase [Planctomycetota bacterium]